MQEISKNYMGRSIRFIFIYTSNSRYHNVPEYVIIFISTLNHPSKDWLSLALKLSSKFAT